MTRVATPCKLANSVHPRLRPSTRRCSSRVYVGTLEGLVFAKEVVSVCEQSSSASGPVIVKEGGCLSTDLTLAASNKKRESCCCINRIQLQHSINAYRGGPAVQGWDSGAACRGRGRCQSLFRPRLRSVIHTHPCLKTAASGLFGLLKQARTLSRAEACLIAASFKPDLQSIQRFWKHAGLLSPVGPPCS